MNTLPVDVSNSKRMELSWVNGFSFKLYENTQPWNKEIQEIQKGLLLVHNGVELVGEGGGFGLPLAIYKDKTVFPGTARVSTVSDKKIIKEFVFNRISRKVIRRISIPDILVKKIETVFNIIYLKSGASRRLFDELIRFRRIVGVKTEFKEIRSRGRVTVIYELCDEDSIHITLLFGLSMFELLNLVVLNEQGAEYFKIFQDSNDLSLTGMEIGAWKRVTAEESYFVYPDKNISFRLQNRDDAELFRGWEMVHESHSWAGLDYSFKPRKKFEYKIKFIIR